MGYDYNKYEKFALEVFNKVYMDYVITDYGYDSRYPILDVTIGVSNCTAMEKIPGFVTDSFLIRKIFKDVIGQRFDKRTLVQEGVPVPKRVKLPVVRVDFSPSMEGISRHFYRELKPVIERLGINLDYVTTTMSIAKTKYPGEKL